MEEQIFSFKDSLRTVWRHRRVAAVFALIGLLLGLGYAIAVPALPSAKSLVLFPPQDSTGLPTQSIATEAQIALSPGILEPAAKQAGVSLPYPTLVHRVTVTGVTGSILQIVAKAPSAAQAERLANAIATTFTAYASNQNNLLVGTTVSYLGAQESQDNAQIALLKNELTSAEAAERAQTPGSQAAVNASTLVATQTEALDTTQQDLKLVKSQIAQAMLTGQAPGSGVTVFERATTAQKPSVLRIPEFGVIGLLIGLLVGIVVAFAVGKRDKRLRARDEIARAAGAPVLASLTAVRRRKSEDLLEVLDHFEPTVLDKANLRRLFDELGVDKRSAHGEGSHSQNGSSAHHEGVGVHAIVLAGDERAVAAATELPAFAATLGLPVALVLAGSSTSTEQLAIACAARDPLELDAPRPNLLTYASAPGKAPAGVALAVTLEVVDPRTLDVADIEPSAGVPGRHEAALLVVSSGYAKPEDLEVVASAAEHHGRALTGVVVAGPEPSDKTSGLQQPRRLMGPNGPRQIAAIRSANR